MEVYKRSYDKGFPVICMDKSPKQLIREVKTPIKAKPRSGEKYDYEYERRGVCNIFMANEPAVKINCDVVLTDLVNELNQCQDDFAPCSSGLYLLMGFSNFLQRKTVGNMRSDDSLFQ